jgi:hypothetical protein
VHCRPVKITYYTIYCLSDFEIQLVLFARHIPFEVTGRLMQYVPPKLWYGPRGVTTQDSNTDIRVPYRNLIRQLFLKAVR